MEGESSNHAVEQDLLFPCRVVIKQYSKGEEKKSRATQRRPDKNLGNTTCLCSYACQSDFRYTKYMYVNGVCASFMYEYTPTMYRHGMGFQV